jgi:AmmeMemoRadiSam system protein A
MVPMSLNKEYEQQLLAVAKTSIQQGLESGRPIKINLADYPRVFTEFRATFVTLELHQQLRGCIGRLEATRPLIVDVAENAFLAAFQDPRFPPLVMDELTDLEIHISLLTEYRPIIFCSEQDLIKQLQPNIDGLILEEGHQRGTFLPSVWEQLPEPKQFLRHLKLKSGLATDYWSDTIKVYRYQTQLIS